MPNESARSCQRDRREPGVCARILGAVWWLPVAVVGCAEDAPHSEVVAAATLPAALVRAQSCPDAEERLRDQALRRMNAQVDRAVENAYQQLSRACPTGPTATTAVPVTSSAPPPSTARAAAPSAPTTPAAAPPSGATPAASMSTPAPGAATPAANPSQSAAAPSSPMVAASSAGAAGSPAVSSNGATATSTTNNQVAEVDEADIVKNDNKYVYATMNGAFRVLTAWPPEEAKELARVPLPGTAKKLFVHEDRALVYVSIPPAPPSGSVTPTGSGTSSTASVAPVGTPPRPSTMANYASRSECTYGYDCQFGGDGTATALLVFDISNREKPEQLRRIDLRGSLIAARRIGTAVHTVVVTPEFTFPGLNTNLPGINVCDPWLTKEQIDLVADSVRLRNTRIIQETQIPQLAPYVREGEQEYAADTCDSMYYDQQESGAAYTSLVSLDLTQNAAPSIATIVSKAGAVYASDASLYMAVPRPQGYSQQIGPNATPPTYESVIHKFRVGSAAKDVAYLASGSVKGHVLNQFSMDEYEAHLRIATTAGKVPMPNVHSTLSVLEQRGAELQVVGKVDDIAPGEDIRSVRFDRKHGFVVTFKKTDPLYMFDLSNPEEPRITGELKIPGFSTYMHMLDDTHLLSIGYDADDQGSFAYFSGVLLQMFDVSDPEAPALLHKTVIGTRGSSSEALTNHLAFTLFQDKLALPMTICEGGGVGSFGTNMTFSGLMVFDVSLENGLVEHGRVAHPSLNGTYDNAGCSNWWTRASSVVQRSIFMDDYVYSIAPNIMRVQRLSAMGNDVSSVPLTP